MNVTGHRQFRTGSDEVSLEENSRFVFYQRDEVGERAREQESKRAREAERREKRCAHV